MGFTLAAYGIDAFQEFIMPQIDNADYSISLSKNIYGIKENIQLNFEILDGVWRFVSTSKNVHVRSQSLHLGMALETGSLIQLRQDDVSISVLVMELDQNLARFSKYRIANPCRLVIGAAEGCNVVYDFQSLISRSHAVLEVNGASCKIIDTSRNGIYMDGRRIRQERTLGFGEIVNIFGLQIIWLGAVLALGTTGQLMKVWSPDLELLEGSTNLYPNGYRQLTNVQRNLFHRSPRMLPKLHTDDIEIEAVPQPTKARQRPLLLQIGPPMTMVLPMLLGTAVAFLAASSSGYAVSPYMYTGIVIAAASALLGVMWALLNVRQSKKEAALEEQNRMMRYQAYLDGIEQDILAKAQENRSILENAYPAAGVCAGYDAYCPMLWSRNNMHTDVLFTRLGLGDMPFQCKIKIPKKTFTLYDDELAEKPKEIHDSYQVLHNVPVGIDLAKRHLVGVVGDGKTGSASGIIRTIATQIAANTCYTDVKLVFLGSEALLRSGGEWGFARWLPHVWSENKVTRFCACSHTEITEVCLELAETIRVRSEEKQKTDEESAIPTPYYVVFIESLELLRNESIVQALLEPQNCGITTVIMANDREELPNVCENVIEAHGARGSIYNLAEGIASGTDVMFDQLTAQEAEQFARNISGIEVSEIETGGAIPDSLTFLDMWKVKTLPELNVLERWRKNRTYETMRALIGERAGGRECYLDIHEKHHGPHGLLAGTTGSGKSETLQTYMLSMAINYSPDDVAFFVIDYKGGGMANLFSGLPHMIGQISNLSGNQVHRAMVSIKSENRRRQQLFNECGVNHIDSYTRLYKNGETSVPLPHLLIIIDEFAELKKEEAPFMRELISVAQVGRSLGVHLILATQKPDGTVDDNIRCNAKFRICLRVQDRQDSNEMLHRPDAAYITQAGRAFMQVGNDEIFEEFQSGWSGADYDEAFANGSTSIASIRTNTGKPAIVGNYLKKQQKDSQRCQWLRTLMGLAAAAAQELGEPLPAMVENSRKLDRLAECMYEKIGREHLDYPRSKANDIRLKGFLRVFAEHVQEDWREERVIREIVAQVNQSSLKLPELKERTQLTAVLDYLEQIAEQNGYTHSFRLWLPVLPERLCLNDVKEYRRQVFDGTQWFESAADWTLDAIVGLSDNPTNQVQDPMAVSFSENGNLAICGSAGSGKSTFLQTLLFSLSEHYTPAWLNYYILDFSNKSLAPFARAPHCGGVVCEDDPERTARLFNMMDQIMKERRTLLRGGSYSQFVHHNGTQAPAVLLVIDNYASFKEKTGGAYEARLLTLSREGANYGIFLAVTAGGFGGAEISNRVADNFRNTVCLELGDKFKYGDVLRNLHFDVMPEPGVQGRGIAPVQGSILEYQTALAVDAPDDYSRANRLEERFAAMQTAWKGKPARRIPEIPEKPRLQELSELEEYGTAIANRALLPYAYFLSDASVCSVELRNTFCWLIAGKPRTGKTTLVQVLLEGVQRKHAASCVIELEGKKLEQAAGRTGATYVNDAQSLFAFTREFQQMFLTRNRLKQELLLQDMDEDELFEQMCAKTEPFFVFIDDFAAFMSEIYRAHEGMGTMNGFYENVFERGALHNVYIIAAVNTERMAALSGLRAFEYAAAYKTGILLGGNAAAQKLLDFSTLPYAEQSKPYKPGLGLLPIDMEHNVPRKVVLPQIKRRGE